MEEEILDLKDLWKIIRRRKWSIIGITAIFMILGLAAGIMSQKSSDTSKDDLYKSSASILITNFPDEKSQNIKGQVELNQQLTNAYGSIAESRTVAEKTIRQVNLNVKTDEFMENIKVVANANSQVIAIHYSEDKVNNQQKVLNAYVRNFIEEASKVYPQGKLKVLDEPSKTERISKDGFAKLTTPVQQNQQQTTTQTTQTTEKTKNKKLILVVSLFLGLMVGFCAAFVVEYMDNTLKKREEAEYILGQTTLGITSYSNFRDGEEYQEAFRSLRTNLQYKDGNVFMVTSPSCKDGKTSVCIGLAKSFANAGYKTLIIDANGRNPQINIELNLDNKHGLSNVLKGNQKNFEKFLVQTKLENIYALCWGNENVNPSDLLTKVNLKVLLDELKKKFDYVIIDTPAMTKYSDAQIVAKAADNILVLMTEYNTNKNEAKRFKEIVELSKMKVNGLIWREGKI